MSLRLTNVAKTFAGGARALLPTDLEIKPGEVVSLLGPSGCGKTTLLRIIAGLETPDQGAAVCFGEDDVTQLPVEKRKVGMVFQSYALFPNMSVADNIAYGLRMQRLPRAEVTERVAEVLSLCRLQEFGGRAITALSGGQRQRVALARAIAPRPRILLLDEPLSALDAALRVSLRDELAALLRRFGTTAIFVTHDQEEALAIADRVAVMQAGRILQIGAPQTLYHRPTTEFVASFVGNAMALKGRIEADALHLDGGVQPLPRVLSSGAKVMVRGENLRLDPEGPLRARVTGVTFLGAQTRVSLAGLTEAPVIALMSGAEPPKRGDIVPLSIAPETLLTFDPRADASALGGS